MKGNKVQDQWIKQMSNGPLWYDIDMVKAVLVGMCVGIAIGIIFRG